MSRSYKKPYVTDSRHGRWKEKRFAAKKARNADLADGKHYRKVHQSYRICDYAWYSPEYQEARRK